MSKQVQEWVVGEQQIGDGPIEAKAVDVMSALAKGIDTVINGKTGDKKFGFVLLLFPLQGHAGRCNYMSNAQRDDVLVLLKEQVARFEAAYATQGGTA